MIFDAAACKVFASGGVLTILLTKIAVLYIIII